MGSFVRRGALYAAVTLSLLLLVWPLTARLPLIDPDEGLHAAIAQEMVARGDYLTPTFLGQPFFDKPILFFWAQMASMQLPIPVSAEVGVRLPGLLFGALGAITTGLLAAELLGGTTGWVAACLYATMLLPLAEAQVAVHDVALVPWTNLSLLLLWRAHRASIAARMASRRVLVATLGGVGLCFGLAILTKGLSGVAIVGVAAGGVLMATRRLTVKRLAALAGCLLLGLLIAAPWYVAMEQAHPGYLRYYFVQRHLLGYVAAAARHAGRPWWYYVPILLGGAFPWVAYLVATAHDQRRSSVADARVDGAVVADDGDAERRAQAIVAVSVWLAAGLLFLTVGRVKLWTYALPLFPALAILAAAPWARRLGPALHAPGGRARLHSGPMKWAIASHALVGSALLPAVLIFARVRYGVDASPLAIVGIVAIAAGYALAARQFQRGRARVAFGGLLALFMATVAITMGTVMPTVAEIMSERDLATHFNRVGALPARLWLIDDRVGSFVFYLDPVLRRGLTADRVQSINVRAACDEVAAAPPETVVAVRERRAAGFLRLLDLDLAPDFDRAGQFRLYDTPDLAGARAGDRAGRPALVACRPADPRPPAHDLADVASR